MMMTMLEIGRFSDSVAMDMDSSETFELFSGGAMAGLSSVSGERERGFYRMGHEQVSDAKPHCGDHHLIQTRPKSGNRNFLWDPRIQAKRNKEIFLN